MRRCLQRCMNFVAIQKLSLAGFGVSVGVDPVMHCNFTTMEFQYKRFCMIRGLNSTCTVLARSVHDLWRDQISLSIVQVRQTYTLNSKKSAEHESGNDYVGV